MNRSPVISLGYVVVASDERAAWRDFAAGVLGMSTQDDAGDLLLRMDDRVARIIVSPPSADRVMGGNGPFVVGWECPSEAEWQRSAQAIEKAGVAIASVPETSWYTEAFSCIDPAGVQCEFFYGGKVDPGTHFVSPLGVTFVTGDQGLGHVTISTPRCRESVEFYNGVLDFQLRETKITGVERAWRWAFLSPSEREHSIAVMNTGRDGQLMHILIEVSDLDTVGRVMDRCLDGMAPMSVSLGRHWNDEMVSFYVRTPSGFDVEYGYGGRKVDAAQWSRRAQGGSGAVSLWGHRIVRSDGTLGPQIGSGHRS
ncbi:MAG TPA: VOC family protein [Mycobacterium sp.]|jgi:3,4-dihydroxy-9,10-secoandrosta-1,3,5(10)-triene-9,17-dione 4,5-dioxygenase|nr:VOC family protein [Mycobacterium sp.]